MTDYKALGGEGSRTPVSYAYVRQDPGQAFCEKDSERVSRRGNAWMALDVISFVIGWPAFGDIRNRSIGELVSAMKMVGSYCAGGANPSNVCEGRNCE